MNGDSPERESLRSKEQRIVCAAVLLKDGPSALGTAPKPAAGTAARGSPTPEQRTPA